MLVMANENMIVFSCPSEQRYVAAFVSFDVQSKASLEANGFEVRPDFHVKISIQQ